MFKRRLRLRLAKEGGPFSKLTLQELRSDLGSRRSDRPRSQGVCVLLAHFSFGINHSQCSMTSQKLSKTLTAAWQTALTKLRRA